MGNASDKRDPRLLRPQVRAALVNAYLCVQRKYEEEGRIPKGQGTILSRYRLFWELIGAAHLGLLIATASIVFNFIVMNVLLHMSP